MTSGIRFDSVTVACFGNVVPRTAGSSSTSCSRASGSRRSARSAAAFSARTDVQALDANAVLTSYVDAWKSASGS